MGNDNYQPRVPVEYFDVDAFFESARAVSIGRDVREQIRQEHDRPIPFSQTDAGKQASQWSGLLNKVL